MKKNSVRILIVDDNVSIHEDFKNILGSISDFWRKGNELKMLEKDLFGESEQESNTIYKIDDAFQGEEAINMFKMAEKEGNPYTLVFMDVRMPPGMDGIRTSLAIWETDPCAEIVLCTAYSDYSWDEIISKVGQTDHLLFIKKPFDTVTVRQMVIALVRKWQHNYQQKIYTRQLEKDLDERCRQIKSLQDHLSSIKKSLNTEIVSKSSFLSDIHYAINTPLSGIMGMADLLLDTDLNEDQRMYAKTLIASAGSLMSVTGTVFLATDNEADEFKPDCLDFDIRTMLENTAEFIRIIMPDKKINILQIVHPDVPDKVFGDPGGVRQIVMQICNFLINEKQSTKIILYLHTNDKNINNTETFIDLVNGSDNYYDIFKKSEDDLTKWEIDKFDKLKKENKNLQIADKIADKINAVIGISENKNRFLFRFGSNFEKSDKNICVNNIDNIITGVRVLVLGKNPVSRKVLSLYIQHWDGKVFEAMDVNSAIEQVQSAIDTITPFNLVIVDLDNTGIQEYVDVITRFRRYSNLLNIPLICITAHTQRGDSQILKNAGYWAYLTKPLKKTHLFLCINILYKISKGQIHYSETGFLTRYKLDEFSNVLRYRVLVLESGQTGSLTSILEMHGIRCDTVQYTLVDSIKTERKNYDAVIMDGINNLENAIRLIRKFDDKILKIILSKRQILNITDTDNTVIIIENEQELIKAVKNSRRKNT
ncbi:MAG: response regulator [Fibrobacter sp.]|nr:response regulator [Fibrobacter sp.]